MISIEKINKEIEELEQGSSTSYSIIEKLAMLYTVRDHLMQSGSRQAIGYRISPKSSSDGEVARITEKMNRYEIEDEYREHMERMRERHPSEYESEMERMRRTYDRYDRDNRR